MKLGKNYQVIRKSGCLRLFSLITSDKEYQHRIPQRYMKFFEMNFRKNKIKIIDVFQQKLCVLN